MVEKLLIVRDGHTGKPIPIPTSNIPAEIPPDNWFENGYWRYRPDKGILEPIIMKYLEDKNHHRAS